MSTVLFSLIFTAILGIGIFLGKNIEKNSTSIKIPRLFERLLVLLICIAFFCYVWVLATSYGEHMQEKHDNDINKTIHSSNVHCPMRVAVASDDGQLGNKFFEFLTSRFMADALQSEIYITPEFAELYDKYFIGRSTPIVDWNYLDNVCSLPRSIFVTLPMNYLPDLKLTSTFTPNYIKFSGKFN
jgi:hypothetical protein